MTPDQVDEIDRQKAASRAEDQADKIAMKHRGTYYRAGGRENRGDRGARGPRGARGVREPGEIQKQRTRQTRLP